MRDHEASLGFTNSDISSLQESGHTHKSSSKRAIDSKHQYLKKILRQNELAQDKLNRAEEQSAVGV